MHNNFDTGGVKGMIIGSLAAMLTLCILNLFKLDS